MKRDGLFIKDIRDHIVFEKDEEGVTHQYHTNWRRGELLPFRSTWPEQWQREAREENIHSRGGTHDKN